jgi:crossover junction endodeoxyribonuclease RuvC
MFVLGIDPGLTRCGFGAVRRIDARRSECVEYGVLCTPAEDALPARLASMLSQMTTLMARLSPDAVVVERVFFQVNARTAMSVGQASGFALALAHDRGCDVSQYTSNEVKLAVTGDGAADKRAVQAMVQRLLSLDAVPKPVDASDALALALCHIAVAPGLRRAAGATGIGRAFPTAVTAASTTATGTRPLRIATQIGGIPLAKPTGGSREATSKQRNESTR